MNECSDVTGAEFATLIEDCGLHEAAACAFFGVRRKTLQYWSRTTPPPGAADEIMALRDKIYAAARATVQMYVDAASDQAELTGVDLYRYHYDDYDKTRAAADGLPYKSHCRVIARAAEALEKQGISVRIVWATPSEVNKNMH